MLTRVRGIAASQLLAVLALIGVVLVGLIVFDVTGAPPTPPTREQRAASRPTVPRDSPRREDSLFAASAEANGSADEAPLPPLQQDFYTLRTEEIENGRRHYVRNLIAGPLQFELRFDKAEGVVSDPVLPLRVTVPPLTERAIVDVKLAPDSREASFSLIGEAVPGLSGASQSGAARYSVPFTPETRWSLDQGFDGKFSHHDVQARYALDFGVDIGTPVLAAREGTVMHRRDDFETASTANEAYAERSNVVRVLHDDGTMGVYAHLSPRSVMVDIGQRVIVGTPLALSGNTGYSTGPHLHFAVQRNAGMKLESIPFDMDDVDERRPD
jgi:murein DD-endopeptidase MepM/ murein hydrolase activator NlpD